MLEGESLYIFIIEKQSLNFNDWAFMAQKLARQIIQRVPVNWNNSVGSQLNGRLNEEEKKIKNSFENNYIEKNCTRTKMCKDEHFICFFFMESNSYNAFCARERVSICCILKTVYLTGYNPSTRAEKVNIVVLIRQILIFLQQVKILELLKVELLFFSLVCYI